MKSQSMHLRGCCILVRVQLVVLGLLMTGAEGYHVNPISTSSTMFDNNDASDHSVLKVDKAGYDACDASAAFDTITTIEAGYLLEKTGWRYFICGNPGHCVPLRFPQNVSFDVVNADGSKNTTTSLSSPNVSGASPRVDMNPVLTWLGVVALVNAASFYLTA